jgi:hypothetical protein
MKNKYRNIQHIIGTWLYFSDVSAREYTIFLYVKSQKVASFIVIVTKKVKFKAHYQD